MVQHWWVWREVGLCWLLEWLLLVWAGGSLPPGAFPLHQGGTHQRSRPRRSHSLVMSALGSARLPNRAALQIKAAPQAAPLARRQRRAPPRRGPARRTPGRTPATPAEQDCSHGNDFGPTRCPPSSALHRPARGRRVNGGPRDHRMRSATRTIDPVSTQMDWARERPKKNSKVTKIYGNAGASMS